MNSGSNPLVALIHSRKFLLLCLDVIVSTVLFVAGKSGNAQMAEDVKALIALYQPVFIAIIAAIAYEDAALARSK